MKNNEVIAVHTSVKKENNIPGNLSYGGHCCHFYQTKEDLIDVLVPYFKSGLENNECCIWVTSHPLNHKEAEKALREALPDLGLYLTRGQMEIIPHDQWYTQGGTFERQRVLDGWSKKLTDSLMRGYSGLRISGNLGWSGKRDWTELLDYEKQINDTINDRKLIVICSYPLSKHSILESVEIVHRHQFTIIKEKDRWESLESQDNKRIVEGLQSSEIQYASLFNNSPLSLWKEDFSEIKKEIDVLRNSGVRDFKGYFHEHPEIVVNFASRVKIIDVNKATLELYKAKDKEHFCRSLNEIFCEESFDAFKEELVAIAEGKNTAEFEAVNKTLDGNKMNIRLKWVVDPGYEITYSRVTVSITDITDNKSAKDALKESEERYRLLAEAAQDIIFIVDRQGIVQYINSFGARQIGLAPEEVMGRLLTELFSDDISRRFSETIIKFFESYKPIYSESKVFLKDKEVWLGTRFVPIINKEGKVDRLLGISRDISERKHTEELLRYNESLYRAIIEDQTELICRFLPDGTITFVNDSYCRYFGKVYAELIGKSFMSFISEEDRSRISRNLALISKEDPFTLNEEKVMDTRGEIRWQQWVNRGIFDQEGNLIEIQAVGRDITETKKTSERLTRINECLLNFGEDAIKNINSLTALCGELLSADCALYNHLDKDLICSWGKWNTPKDYEPTDKAEGHICYDVIRDGSKGVIYIPNLPGTSYFNTDPNVSRYNLQTYLGCPVKFNGTYIGSLCAVYVRNFIPTEEDKELLSILASAIANEEERYHSQQELNYWSRFETLITGISTRFINLPEDQVGVGIGSALQELGEFIGVDRAYIFMRSQDESKVSKAYEWCAPGIESNKEEFQNIPIDKYPWIAQKLLNVEALYIPDLNEFPVEATAERELFKIFGLKSLICIPMAYSGKVFGFLGFDAARDRKIWGKESEALLNILSDIFGNILQRRNSQLTLQSRERFLSSIFSSIQDGICIIDKELTVLRVNPKMEEWYAHALPLVGKKCYEVYHGKSEPCQPCPSLRTIRTAKAEYNVVPKIGPNKVVMGWQDLFTFPLFDTITGKLEGVIEYVRDITDRKLAEQKLEETNKELSIFNEKLKQSILRDPHTGLYSHHYLGEVIEAEFHRARRYGNPLSVIMLDMDYFKSINDVYGHPFGDLVLKQLAQQLKRLVRRYDIVIRFGGEEFVIISPGTDRPTAYVLAQRILNAINLYNFGKGKHLVKVKLSIAVASYPEDKVLKGIDLVELAEKIVGKVKEAGGNTVYSSFDIKAKEESSSEKLKESSDIKFLRNKIEKLTKRTNQSLMESVFAFAKTIEVKDHYTGEHVEMTVKYATEIAKTVSLSGTEIEEIRQAAMLHDLGKIGISEKILQKKGKLTKTEFQEIKKHPQIGVDIIRPIQFLHNIIPSVLYHHERWDGKGYPSGLKGDEIPVGARIVAIADVYQALISDRPYRKAFARDEALRMVRDGAGTQFDPQIVGGFLKIIQ